MINKDLNDFQKILTKNNISYTTGEPLAPKTTFKVGGNTAIFIKPQNSLQLITAISLAASSKIKFFVLGGGSNVVFPDGQYNGAVISTQGLNSITFEQINQPFSENKVLVTCRSGTPTATFVNFCTQNNLSGAQQFAGLPGSIGGAAFMNARCFDKSISDIFYSGEYIDFSNSANPQIIKIPFESTQWDYKKSPFQNGTKIITKVTFLLEQKPDAEHSAIEEECKKYIAERVTKGHFKYPSAGSVFKNNHNFGKPSGKIIDEAGLKGYSIGGAQIAPFHGNFIINTGNAKSSEIYQLVLHIQKIVYEKFGFSLEPEIIFVDKQLYN